jgi:hypothetical protein
MMPMEPLTYILLISQEGAHPGGLSQEATELQQFFVNEVRTPGVSFEAKCIVAPTITAHEVEVVLTAIGGAAGKVATDVITDLVKKGIEKYRERKRPQPKIVLYKPDGSRI